MKKFLATLIVSVFVIGLGTAHATTIDFDLLSDPGTTSFEFADANFTDWQFQEWTNNNNNIISGAFSTQAAYISFDMTVDISNLYVMLYGTNVTVNGTNLGDLTYTGNLVDLDPKLFSNVDNITFQFGGMASVDLIEYAATPIPGAAWLLGSGLIGLVGMRRKFLA